MAQLKLGETPPPKFIPSKYQEGVFDFVKNEKGNGIINAVAGSGKTTTILKSLSFIPKDKKVVFCAFNKHIADNLKSKVPENVWATTIHGAGYRTLRISGYNPIVLKHKQEEIIDQVLRIDKVKLNSLCRGRYHYEDVEDELLYPVRNAVNMMKASMLPETSESIEYITDFYDIYVGDNKPLFDFLVQRSMQVSLLQKKVIDFYDMVWMPLKLKLYVPQYDFVFIDELQDLNKMQIEFALKMKKADGRIIGVGDPAQSLYGFMGASTEAMEHTTEVLDATTLPLSISYRCPVGHVKMAQKYVPYIEHSPTAIEGKIHYIDGANFLDVVHPGDMVICRNNAPLIDFAFEALDKGYKVNIRGRDLGHGLINIVKKGKVKTIPELLPKLEKWKEFEMQKAVEEKRNPARIEDKYKVLTLMCSKVKTTSELIAYIQKLFSDENEEIVFSSIHRAKGLEADRIFIIKFGLIPNKWARQDWELQQERNCAYVALTRAKKELYFVE